MRITESQLRRIVRKLMKEAPLMDLYPPRVSGSRAIGQVPDEDVDAEPNFLDSGKMKADRIFATKSFAEKLKKLVANWPVDVWVAPVASDTNFLLEEDNDRFIMLDPEEILNNSDLGDPELRGVVAGWMEKSGGHGALFVPYAKGSLPNNEITPWMILHGMFNVRPFPGYSGYAALQEAEEVIHVVKKAVENLFFASAWGFTDEKEALEAIERVFTMGSARNKYFSKFNEFQQLNDIDNEAAVQSITKGGFRYDKEALQAFRDRCTAEEPVDPVAKQARKSAISHFSATDPNSLIDEAQDLLDKAVALSPKARSDFMRGIVGKVIIVNVT